MFQSGIKFKECISTDTKHNLVSIIFSPARINDQKRQKITSCHETNINSDKYK